MADRWDGGGSRIADPRGMMPVPACGRAVASAVDLPAGYSGLVAAIVEGAVLRVRPIAMTVAVIIASLLPIMLGSGTGSEVMRRIAAPMVGGMITAPLLSMLVVPAAYLLMLRWRRTRS